MAQPYLNVENSLPDPSTYNFHGPFGMQAPTALTYKAAADRRETIAPFIQRAGLADQLALQKQQQETEEFTSPQAIQARMSEFPKQLAQNQVITQNAPIFGEKERKQAQGDISLIPGMTREKAAEIRQKTFEAEDAPTREAAAMFAANHENMQNAKTDMERAAIHKSIVDRWHQKYPNLPAPKELQGWHPDMMKIYQTMAAVQNMTPEYFKARMEQQEATKRTGMTQAGESARTTETLRERAPVSLRLMQVNRNIAALAANDPKRQALLDEQEDLNLKDIDERVDKEIKAISPTDPVMATAMGPKLLETNIQQRQNRRMQLMIQRGMAIPITFMRDLYPGKSDEEIKKAAQAKSIKLKE